MRRLWRGRSRRAGAGTGTGAGTGAGTGTSTGGGVTWRVLNDHLLDEDLIGQLGGVRRFVVHDAQAADERQRVHAGHLAGARDVSVLLQREVDVRQILVGDDDLVVWIVTERLELEALENAALDVHVEDDVGDGDEVVRRAEAALQQHVDQHRGALAQLVRVLVLRLLEDDALAERLARVEAALVRAVADDASL